MAYSPKTWVLTDPITPTDLNRIETGIDALDTRIQAGQVTMPSTAALSTSNVAVVFPVPFSTIPVVTLAAETTSPADRMISVSGISTTGCKVYFYNGRSTEISIPINWIAVGV